MLDVVETGFINSKRGEAPQAHADIYKKAVNLMTSKQMAAFSLQEEKPEVCAAYGNNNFGRGLLMARRLVEIGVPFVEVTMDGWDLHQRVFDDLKTRLHAQSRPGLFVPGRRSVRPRNAGAHGNGLHGRVRPHAPDQPTWAAITGRKAGRS